MSITTVFDPPLPSDSRETFNSKAFDTVAKLNSWSAQANQLATDINADVTNPGVVAVGADLIGSNTIGTVAAVADDVSAVAAIDADVSAVAAIAADVSAVAANEANINEVVDNLPNLAAKVSKTGDTMTGHLSVPAGATGTEVPQAQEIFGKGQSWQTVTRISGVTYTNSTGKPITVIASSDVIDLAPGLVYIEVDGVYADQSWGRELNDVMVINFVVPPGSTYKITGFNASDLIATEYR